MGRSHRTGRLLIELLIAAALGATAVVIPVALDPGRERFEAALFPVVREAVEGMKLYSLALLAATGFGLGFWGRGPVWLIGPATMAAFPVWSAVDMAAGNAEGHNLWPIEWGIYGLLSLLGLLGAVLGRNAARSLASP